MPFYELSRPEEMPVDTAVAYLQGEHRQVIDAGLIDFKSGPRDTVLLELKRGTQDLDIVGEHLSQKGYPVITGAMTKPIGVSFLSGEWKASISVKPGHNRSKYEKIGKDELEHEFATEVAAGALRFSVGRSKNLFFAMFNGRSLPRDFRQRLGVVGSCTLSKAKPAHYYYGPKQEVSIP
ncbi:MAG: hypothetical protein HRT94_01215 [Alphaproteobacteria bacterium]|nr:hypothetical protein [Alphaproteobacteria bacterium]